MRIVAKNNKFMAILSFRKVQNLLSEENSMRVHKSVFVAINRIDCIERGRIIIGERHIPIGETYKNQVQQRINGLYL
jgi:hypothetical protein